MITDHRLQVHLPDNSYQSLKMKAQEEGKSLGAVVREAVAAYVTKTERDRILEGYERLKGLAGIGRDVEGKTDVSEKHDEYVGDAVEDEFLRKTGRPPK